MLDLRIGQTTLILVLSFTLVNFAYAQRNQQRISVPATQTKEAERRLSELGYWTGPIDGQFDAASRSALIAFQKWENRSPTGQLTGEELEAIRISTSPKARDTGYAHVEVDIDRQVLLIVDERDVVKVLPVSTGSGKPFIDEDQTSVAYTPRGRFIVYEKESGWEYGPLGALYFANYISGGVAIHGSRNVPTRPETHGCIRVPVFAARELSRLMPLGTIVLVYDKISFVSGKAWAENPKLKQTASIE
jgi:peptidoglycan hydrolase-like protein with peptidoglycan-binding domain